MIKQGRCRNIFQDLSLVCDLPLVRGPPLANLLNVHNFVHPQGEKCLDTPIREALGYRTDAEILQLTHSWLPSTMAHLLLVFLLGTFDDAVAFEADDSAKATLIYHRPPLLFLLSLLCGKAP